MSYNCKGNISSGVNHFLSPIEEIRLAILNNEPIEEYLHVIMVISNPCGYLTRYRLAKEFIARMKKELNVKLYIVELVYNDQKFQITEPGNPMHLQLRTGSSPIWSKENMINLGIQLLPKNWKAFSWCDADIQFENPYFALESLKILNGCRDIIQLFSHADDLDPVGGTMNVFSSFGYQYKNGKMWSNKGVNNSFHPGYAYAITRAAYEKIGGLYANSILGSGDHNIVLSVHSKSELSLNSKVSKGYKKDLEKFQEKAKNLRFGYTPGVIRHYFHGTKADRKYSERWQILVKHQYDPNIHLDKDSQGLIIPNKSCPPGLLADIKQYFVERNEDFAFNLKNLSIN